MQQILMGLHCFASLRIAWQSGSCIRLGARLKTHSKDCIAKTPNPTDNTESTSRTNATEPFEHVSRKSLKILQKSLRKASPRGRTSKEPTQKKLHRYVEKVLKKHVGMVVLLCIAAHCLALVLTSSQGLTVTHDPFRVM